MVECRLLYIICVAWQLESEPPFKLVRSVRSDGIQCDYDDRMHAVRWLQLGPLNMHNDSIPCPGSLYRSLIYCVRTRLNTKTCSSHRIRDQFYSLHGLVLWR